MLPESTPGTRTRGHEPGAGDGVSTVSMSRPDWINPHEQHVHVLLFVNEGFQQHVLLCKRMRTNSVAPARDAQWADRSNTSCS
eukprot:6937603-Prymnesium_polylepis.1